MKKYLLIISTIILSFTACTNDEDYNPSDENGTAIEFRSVDEDKTTSSLRASVTTNNTITSFTVTGWWDKTNTTTPDQAATNYGDNDASKGVYLFDAFNIARGETTNSTEWNYSPKRYWPAAGKGYVDFYAYSPASSRNLDKGIEGFDGTAITYTVPTLANEQTTTEANRKLQEDFMVAKVIGKSTGTVSLNFQHALSRVTFSARKTNPDITYIVEKVELVNLATKASLDLTGNDILETGKLTYPSPVTPTNAKVLWTGHDAKSTTYTVDMGKSPIFLQYDDPKAATPAYYSLLGDINGLMVMPQTTTKYSGTGLSVPGTNQFAIAVTYKAYLGKFYYAGNETTPAVKYFPVEVSGEPISFEFGRQYNFFLTFGNEAADAIKFDVTVSDWAADIGQILPEYTDYAPLLSQKIKDQIKNVANYDGPITYDDLKATTSLTLPHGTTESDLMGLEYLFALESIRIGTVEGYSSFTGTLKLSNTHANFTTIYASGYSTMDALDISELPANEITIDVGGTYYNIPTLNMRDGQKFVLIGDVRFTNPSFLSDKINAAVLKDSYANLITADLSFKSAVTSNADLKGIEYLKNIATFSFPFGISNTDLILSSTNTSTKARFNFTGNDDASVGTLDVSALPATTIEINVKTSLNIKALIYKTSQTITYIDGSGDKTTIGTTVVK